MKSRKLSRLSSLVLCAEIETDFVGGARPTFGRRRRTVGRTLVGQLWTAGRAAVRLMPAPSGGRCPRPARDERGHEQAGFGLLRLRLGVEEGAEDGLVGALVASPLGPPVREPHL